MENKIADGNNPVQSEVNLNVLESILNGMDAYVYVTDPSTDEVLFINNKMREHFDVEGSIDDGRKCWMILQSDMTDRCPFCPKHRLQDHPDETIVWEEHNTVTQLHYRNSDKLIKWPDGRLVHMQHSVDISEIKEAAAAVDQRLAQQEIMSQISQSFVFDYEIDEMIIEALKMTGEFMGCTRGILFSYHDIAGEMKVTHDWTAEGIGIKNPDAGIPFVRGEYLYDRIVSEHSEIVAHRSLDMSAYYHDSDNNNDDNDTGSCLSTPIYIKGNLIGLLCFDNAAGDHLWESSEIHLTKFLCSMFAGVRERKQAETGLTKMSRLIEYLTQPVVYIDSEESVTYYNAATYEVFGYTEEELLSGGLEMLFGSETYERVRMQIWPKAFSEGFVEIDLPLIHKNGKIRIFSFLGVVINIRGELPQLATFGVDITDLVSSKEFAETASKSKSEFLARMSHEMRTPMNAIIGMTNIAQDSDSLERKEYCLDKISSASTHLLGVINDILDMSKIEANKFDINTAEFDFEKMLVNITNMISFRMEEKNHNFVIDFDQLIPRYIIADEQRLSQVIVNLLSNAVKFTPEEGTITLSVRLIETDGELNRLSFSVTDTGIGISPEQQSKLFNSFEQADGSISRRFGGTGLGLVISKRIVELMGGQISIESELGSGTTFIFDAVVLEGTKNDTPEISQQINRDNLNILLVDDSSATREYFKHLMQRLHLNCDVAESAANALEMMELALQNNTPYNFFFVDFVMPGMDGIEFASIIKERMPADSVVIMVSAAQWSDIESKATSVGINGFIPKPLFPSAIVDCISNCLGNLTNEDKKQKANAKHFDFSDYFILLVEDVEINREIVMALLEETGVKIDIAENGVEAVEKFSASSGKYDLLFMDIHMPIMDGYEATQKIRGSEKADALQIPIIAMTANAFKEDIDRCKEYGMNDHISKPIDRTILLRKMEQWLKK